jgi:hypothetical protein
MLDKVIHIEPKDNHMTQHEENHKCMNCVRVQAVDDIRESDEIFELAKKIASHRISQNHILEEEELFIEILMASLSEAIQSKENQANAKHDSDDLWDDNS